MAINESQLNPHICHTRRGAAEFDRSWIARVRFSAPLYAGGNVFLAESKAIMQSEVYAI